MKKKYMICFVSTLTLTLSACMQGSPAHTAGLPSEKLALVSDLHLCAAYKFAKNKPAANKIIREINKREIATESEWEKIEKGEASIGMTKAQLVCAWGQPHSSSQSSYSSGNVLRWTFARYDYPYGWRTWGSARIEYDKVTSLHTY